MGGREEDEQGGYSRGEEREENRLKKLKYPPLDVTMMPLS